MIPAPILNWLSQLLTERFGTQCIVGSTHAHSGVHALTLQLTSHPGRIVFTPKSENLWENQSDIPCAHWSASKEGFKAPIDPRLPAPGAKHLNTPLVEWTSGGATVHYDILGLTYWMLARLEEIDRTDLDEHDRFPATSSHAYKHGYLERPVVDEWLAILGQIIQRRWPNVQLKRSQFEIKVSHDVDRPTRYSYQPLKGLLRTMAGDLLKRGDLRSAMLAPWIRLNSREKFHRADPFNTFDWIMDQSEAHDLTSAFYFICGRTDSQKDAQYDPDDVPIRHLMRRIHERGHEIGLHPSYNTYQSPDKIAIEAHALWRICEEEDIHQQEWGGRMHYLRWRTPHTLSSWADADMHYDSTLVYADHPGFRCGTCHEYQGFDALQQKTQNVRVRPLIAMESSVISKKYMGLAKPSDAFSILKRLNDRCKAVGGTFTLLWHNSELKTKEQKNLYLRTLNLQG